MASKNSSPAKLQKATFAGGCFWCTEAIFKMIRGVTDVESGYTGGNMEKPKYEDVGSGITNHAEAIQITFDPQKISYEDLLYVFFHTHDPTTLNRQGADVGTQYRSAIFYHSEEQKELAEKAKAATAKEIGRDVVTEIVPAGEFYLAEGYHQDYYEQNRDKMYCKLVIDPKIDKLKKDYSKYLKK